MSKPLASYQALKDRINQFFPLSEESWKLFCAAITERECKKDEIILAAGQGCRSVYFVQQGAIRTYYLHEGKEINTKFSFENSFVTNLKSLRQGYASEVTIQTLETSGLLHFWAKDLLNLYTQSPELESMGRRLLESLLIEQEEQSSIFQLYSPEQRYQLVLEKQPVLLQRVSLTHIASYLGISRESLSRIRNRMRR